MEGSEEDIRATIKAKELEVRPNVELTETIERVRPVHSRLGPEYKTDAKEISQMLASADPQALDIEEGVIALILSDGRRVELGPGFFTLEKRLSSDKGELEHLSADGLSVLLYR